MRIQKCHSVTNAMNLPCESRIPNCIRIPISLYIIDEVPDAADAKSMASLRALARAPKEPKASSTKF